MILKESGSIASANIQKYQFFISFMNWEKSTGPTRAIFKNSNFQYFCELGTSLKNNLNPMFRNPNFESKDELGKAISQFEFYC